MRCLFDAGTRETVTKFGERASNISSLLDRAGSLCGDDETIFVVPAEREIVGI
jgi:hypothetical protein